MAPDELQAEKRVLFRYGAALAFALGAAGVRYLLQPAMGVAPPYITFYLAVVAASALGGLGPGLLATFVGALLGVGLAFGPAPGLQIGTAAEQIRLVIYLLSGVAISWISGNMHRARHRASVEAQELRKLSEELRLANRKLQESDRSKDRFVALVAHELRNPLTPLTNAVRLLRARCDDPEQVRRTADMMARQVAHMTRMVNDLLDATRIRQNKMDLVRTRIDLRDVVTDVVHDYRQQFLARSVALHERIPADGVPVYADAGRLAQVVGNLLHNALKFTPEGAEVHVDLDTREESAVVQVRDRGTGIPPELLQRIFEPFEQGDEVARHAPRGLGLGLALVKTIVELHGGTVAARSAGRGQGAEFVVTLPLDTTPDVEGPLSVISPPEEDAAPPRPSR